jgi:hypothetical protein
MEESMETALARLRAKTDRELSVLIRGQLQRSRKLACRGAYQDAAKDFLSAEALLAVANLPPAERTRIEGDFDHFINVWKNPAPLTFDEARKREGKRLDGDILQNSGAVFFYPGLQIGLPDRCIPSLRLKDYRRGAQDYEYLYLLRKAGQTKLVEEALAAIYNPDAITMRRGGSPKIETGDLGVPMDEVVWERVRRMMGEKLNSISGR